GSCIRTTPCMSSSWNRRCSPRALAHASRACSRRRVSPGSSYPAAARVSSIAADPLPSAYSCCRARTTRGEWWNRRPSARSTNRLRPTEPSRRSASLLSTPAARFIWGSPTIISSPAAIPSRCCSVESSRSMRPGPRKPRLYPRIYRSLFARHAGYVIRGLRRVPAMVASCRRSRRAPCYAAGDASNGFLSQRVAPPDVLRLSRTARNWGVTRNDLFLAMLLQALACVTPARGSAPRRRELGVAAIVNVRAEFEADAVHTFGQFLASLRVSHPVPPGIGLRELALAVHAQTSRIKSEKLYLQTLLALGGVAIVWRLLRADRRRCFLAKHYPIAAGVSSLDIDNLWHRAPALEAATEYLRAVPTGPLAPIVLAITTHAGVIELGVSFRRADVSRELAAGLTDEFLRQWRALPEAAPQGCSRDETCPVVG